ncbi:MAG: OadG family protein [Bacteroidota bacterium]
MFDQFSLSNIIENDGLLITIVGYVIVFMSLLFLYIIIANFQKLLAFQQRKKLKEKGHRAADVDDLTISGDTSAAIATALYLEFEEAHDLENTVLTIKRVQRVYSPWSSKIQGLREYPKR